MTSIAPTERRPVGQFVELGATGLEIAGGVIREEKLRRLQGKQGMLLYQEMRDNDAVIKAGLTTMGTLVRGMTWDVERVGDDQEDFEKAELLKSTMFDMSHSWDSFISEVLSYWAFGWQWSEVVFKQRNGPKPDPDKSSRFNDGKFGIAKFAPRGQDSFESWIFDPEGRNLLALVQRPAPTFKSITIPLDRSLLFKTVSRKNNPEGVSALRGAVRGYLIKRRLEEYEAIGIERDLTGLPLITAPAEWFHADAPAESKALLAELKRIGRNVRMDEQGCVLLPALFDPKTQEKMITFELITAGSRRVIDPGKTIERWNRVIAMSMLTDVVMMGHEQVGSFALASSKTNILSASLGAYADGIVDTLNRDLVPRFFALNGMSLERLPRFTHGDIETIDLGQLGTYIQALAGAGADLFPSEDFALERHLLGQAGLPAPTPEE